MIAGLPYDAEVEYLEITWWQGSATEYIDTGYALTTDVWEIDAVFDCRGTKWGAQTSNDKNWMANQWNDRWWFGTSLGQFSRANTIGGKGRYLWRGSNGVVEGSVEGVSFSGTYTGSVVSGCSCFLFACNQGGSAIRKTIGKVYSFKLSDNGKTVRDMIPVRFTNEQGVSEGAMYDRVSRKLFRNAGTGAFTIGPDVATPVMGLHFFKSQIKTAKDYVQNGLVAMWDGIENAGWGVHDPNATVWKDLIGGQELEFSGTTVNADSVGFVAGACVYSNGNIGLTTANTLQGEICIDIQSPPDNRQYAQFAGSNTRIFALATRARGGISLVNGAAGHGDWPAGKHVLSVYWIDNVLHIDSELRETVTGTDTWSGRNKSTIIGDVVMNGSLGFAGNVHCIRLYSRALTAAEIARNYSVDKERFNLP